MDHDLPSAAHGGSRKIKDELAAAERWDSPSLDSLLVLATDSTVRSSPAYPAVAWALLVRFGDSAFAAGLRRLDPATRAGVIASVDRGSGRSYAHLFPASWSLGPHAPALVPDSVQSVLDTIVDPERTYEPGELNRLAEAEPGSCTPMSYPSDLLHSGISGRVVLELTIDSAGRLAGPLQAVSATRRDFVEPAQHAMRSCRFAPGLRGGRAVRSRRWLPLSFFPEYVGLHGDLVYIAEIARRTASIGIDFSYEVLQAEEGDTAALRTVMRLATVEGKDNSGYYGFVLRGLLQATGEEPFARVLASLPASTREQVVDLAAFNRLAGDTTFISRHPRLAAIAPNFKPAPPLHLGVVASGRDSGRTVETPPEVVPGSCRTPRYPEELRTAGFSGRVILQFIIDTTGRAEPESIRALIQNHPAFVEAARLAIRSCRFRPGRIAGKPVRVRVQQSINFQIN